ncbi:Re/Si-specific NAD(P)(+) transhydrogenase subunit alpha [Govanella unica]|uniref:NAD(P) transhydrogenase subunit alpha part 1 n=1 Tax=Govanella unica TaxID=2975056 RepID=A0A9X3U0N3_9PROT|nr:Re/Si-specific NAD(P)(+) transhydrogenase subunit alpha [Govania unica]MDA5194872.1 Re/Si-specific NAD(P)(+) transhydrogenase subunit alpha [Govania unica]
MKIVIPAERRANETRVAATPDTVKKFKALGFDVAIEKGAGDKSRYPDQTYADAGAEIIADAKDLYAAGDIVLKVQRPLIAGEGSVDELALMKKGAVLAAILNPYQSKDAVAAYAAQGVTAFAMEFMPRITRAQSMDVLSSQSNLAGYLAVIEAAYEFDRAFPMMMTAAGTIAPARVMVMGAGVAGLQAIATARRLGAIVSATDVRLAAKEQVESLGAKFVVVDHDELKTAETSGGYAKEMSDDFKQKQAAFIAETLKKQDIAICTALIPGRRAPTLITADMVRSMKPGSLIVDLAAEQGGNCELTRPGEVYEVDGVKIIGHANFPSRLATDASALYAKNLLNFLTAFTDKDSKELKLNWDDEIIKGTALTRDGQIIHPALAQGA